MLEYLRNIIDYLGIGNFLTLIIFIFSTLITYYFYFKSFYRLVYSKARVCKTCKETRDWLKSDTEFISRVLFFNNGRKTITKNEVKKLLVKSSNKISKVNILKGANKLNLKLGSMNSAIKVEFEYIDSGEYFLLEIIHTGYLTVEGRILETGQILNTETKTWFRFTMIFYILYFSNMIYNIITHLNSQPKKIELYALNIIVLYLSFLFLRYLHRLFFIPDSLWNKCLDSKDKFDNEFRNAL